MGVGVGLGVNGVAEVVLASDIPFGSRKERSRGPFLFCLAVIERETLQPYVVVVPDSILYALVGRPRFLGLYCEANAISGKITCLFFQKKHLPLQRDSKH